jgi:thiamine-phosphate pyrophosphorylase
MSAGLLYYITDRTQFPGDEATRRRALLAKIVEAARAGVGYIQLREKDLTAHELELLANEAVRVAAELRTEKRRTRTHLLINSRIDLGLATGAGGVHLRCDDISSDARSVWAQVLTRSRVYRRPIIAISCHTRLT